MSVSTNIKKLFDSVLYVWLLVLAALHLYVSVSADGKYWGFDSWAWYSNTTKAILFFLGIALLLSVVTGRISRAVGKIIDAIIKVPAKIMLMLVLLVAGFAIWNYSAATDILGDGALLANSVEQGSFFKKSSPLAMHLVILTYQSAGLLGEISGKQAFRIVSLLSGLLFIVFSWYLARLMASNWSSRALIFCGLITAGFMQLFFGYIEVYPPICAIVLGYLYFSLRLIKTGKGIVISATFFFLCVFSHIASLVLLPSLVYSHYIHWRRQHPVSLVNVTFRCYALPLLGIMFICYLIGLDLTEIVSDEARTRLSFHFLVNADEPMYMFPFLSLDYLRSMFNLISLILPLWLPLLMAVLFSNLSESVEGRFLIIASLISLVLVVFFNPELSYPRDWDVFTFPLLAPAVLGLVALTRTAEIDDSKIKVLLVVVVGAGLLYSGTWVHLNANGTASLLRMERILKDETGLSSNARRNTHEILAMTYREMSELEKAFNHYESMSKLAPDAPRYLINQASTAMALNKLDIAGEKLNKALMLNPQSFEALYLRGTINFRCGNFRQALSDFGNALEINPSHIQVVKLRGATYLQLKDFEMAAMDYGRVLEADSTDLSALENRSYANLMIGNTFEAIVDLEKAVVLKPQSAELLFNLGIAYARIAENQRAVKLIKQAAALGSVPATQFLQNNSIE